MSCKSFFATRADLVPGLRAIDARLSLKYIKGSSWDTSDVPVYTSALDIPDLGVSSRGTMNDPKDIVWVMPALTEFVVRKVELTAGGIVYSWHYRDNPSAFLVWPGGWYEGILLGGGTCPTEFNPQEIVDIQRVFARTLTKGFVKIIGCSTNGRNDHSPWWVGLEALRARETGVRMITYDPDERYAYLDL
jgi:hypothetical protein